jgi:hypothetical protein
MSHLLIIRNAKGEELARVPVKGGYTIQEIPSAAVPKTSAVDKGISVGDNGGGKEKVG